MTRQVTLIAGEPQEFYEVADFFRLLSAVGPLTVEFYNGGREVSEAVGVSKGYAEKFDRGTFDRVRLLSATTQAVQFVTRLGNVVQYDAAPIGDTAIVSSVPLDLTNATKKELIRPEPWTGSYFASSALAANTAEVVFTAAANVNGAIVHALQSRNYAAFGAYEAFMAKATAPASIADGVILAGSRLGFWNGATNNASEIESREKIFVPAGLGVWFISNILMVNTLGNMRTARFQLL